MTTTAPPFRTLLALALAAVACQTERPSFTPLQNEAPASCEARKAELLRFVEALPARALTTEFSTELPSSTLGAAPGTGPVLEVSEESLRLDGVLLGRERLAERLAGATGALYVAAPADVTVKTLRATLVPLPKTLDVKLLVRTESAAGAASAIPGASARARELAEHLLAERDPAARRALVKSGYAELEACAAFEKALGSVAGFPARERWPALKTAILRALPACECSLLDTAGLSAVLIAEQRAGTATLGAVPLAFLRDERCGASMPLRSVKRLLEQMERFDADNAGVWRDDALRFEQIITNERLLVQFCDALPGETLAAIEKARATLYVRLPAGPCEGWTFEPLSPGAPMGTWRRTKAAPGTPPLAFHYWQAAEELGVFGPVSPDKPSKPTDQREWACRVSYRLLGVEADSVALESGRWFFTEAACRAATSEAAPVGCVATLAAGAADAGAADAGPASAGGAR